MMKVDLLVHSSSQLLTIKGGAKRGDMMRELGVIEDGAVAVREGRIALVGRTKEVLGRVEAFNEIDAKGKVVMPGFVDPHTHLVFAGSREEEFERRIEGATYLEIMASGGGIMSTVRATRSAHPYELVVQSRKRLDSMLAYGTTTAEVKTGYGLDFENEMKIAMVIAVLDSIHPIDLVATFLGAHAFPAEYAEKPDEYIDLLIEEMLPPIASGGEFAFKWDDKKIKGRVRVPFCDVFCDEGAFTLRQAKRVLVAAKELGMGLKIHADEFSNLGGAALAAELGAISADHLTVTPDEELRALRASSTIPVLLPCTTFGLGLPLYADARRMIDLHKLPIAIGTDLNPGTSWCESMQFAIAIACRYMGMTQAEAITASTINAAFAIGLGEEVGSIEIGKKADIIILDIPDYRHLGYRFGANLVESVIKSGQIICKSTSKRMNPTTNPNEA
jgi:imidazolonepropionase